MTVVERLLSDLRSGARGVLGRKALSLAIVLTLGLAIGANTTLFSLATTVLFASPSKVAVRTRRSRSTDDLWNPSLARAPPPSS